MKIHVTKLDGKPIFGALRFNLIKYLGKSDQDLLFQEEERGTVFCSREMAVRIRERLSANRLKTKVLDQAINDGGVSD